MSEWWDRHVSYKEALMAARDDLATAAAQLDTAPPGQRAADVTASAQVARAAITALEDALDDADLTDPGPQGALAAHEALEVWLNGLTTTAQLLTELRPDPRRRYEARGDPELSYATAVKILAARAAQGGVITDLARLEFDASLSPYDVLDLENTGRLLSAGIPGDQCVGVLLPMRIETRFLEPGRPGKSWRLQLRVFPESAAIDRSQGLPTQDELDHTLAMWQEGDGHLDTPEGKLAFSKLVEKLGGPRAAWLASHFPPVRATPTAPITLAPSPVNSSNRPLQSRITGIPDTLEVWLARGGGAPALAATTAVDQDRLAADATLTQLQSPDGLPLTWWLSFAQALEVGLGAVIDLGPAPPDDIAALYVVGLSDQDAGPLFAAHRDSGALSLVPLGVPTHTVGGTPAAELGRDPDVWLRQAKETGYGQPGTRELEVALTGSSARLEPLPSGDLAVRGVANALVGALWPALWGRALKDFLGLGAVAWQVGAWATRCLAPEGPFPPIRIGNQPYGVLPVTSLDLWTAHPQDPSIEASMVPVLRLLVGRWAQLAEADGTVKGADTDRFLNVLSRTPTSRWGWQVALPHELIEFLAQMQGKPFSRGTLDAEFDVDVVGRVQAVFGLAPTRRYRAVGPLRRLASGLLDVTDPRLLVKPERMGGSSCPVIEKILRDEAASAMGLEVHDALLGDVEHPAPLLARLVRHSLVLTRADVARLGGDPNAGAPLVLPFDRADEPLNVPFIGSEALLEGIENGGADGPSAVRCYRTVREAAEAICRVQRRGESSMVATATKQLPENRIQQAFLATLECATSRIDPWPTGVATRRLRWLAARGTRFVLGAYGWVDAPRPYAADPTTSVQPPGPTPAGLVHAPSLVQATTAALLRDLAIRRPGDKRWDMTLDSQSIRMAIGLAADVAAGAHLMEALGRRIEQIAGEPGLVAQLRKEYPMRPEHAGRRVCDGEAVLADALAEPTRLSGKLTPLAPDIRPLQQALDVYGDLLVADAVHDLVSGHADLAAEAMEAAAGLARPPSMRVLRTQRAGRTVETITLAVVPAKSGTAGTGPGNLADPSFAALLVNELPLKIWVWTVNGADVKIGDLGLSPVDALIIPEPTLLAKVRDRAGASPQATITGSAPGALASARRMASLLAADDGLPEWLLAGTGTADDLTVRLDALRQLGRDLVATLSAPGGGTALFEAARWGLLPPDDNGLAADEKAADVAAALADRLAAADKAAAAAAAAGASDPVAANARIFGLRSAIRALVSGGGTLPVLYTVSKALLADHIPVASAADGRPAIDESWLETMAAVRPALARLDAYQLGATLGDRPTPWHAWSSHPTDPWCTVAAEPSPSPYGVAHSVRVAYGPPAVLDGISPTVAVSQLDRHAETIPSRRQITGTAFGFNAPKARAPQALLLAVPPDVASPLDAATIVDIVAAARELARARMSTMDALAKVGPALPLSLLLGDGPAIANPWGVDMEAKP